MHATGHSRTAEFMALFRALETAAGPRRRLFDDPWAIGFLRPSLRIVAALARIPVLRSSIAGLIDRRWPGALTADAVDATFQFLSKAAPGSEILFTYVHADALKTSCGFEGMAALKRTLKSAAEPWTFGFDPRELPDYLASRGLTLISDMAATDYRALYADACHPDGAGYEFYRLALAVVPTPGPRPSTTNMVSSVA
jgi:O-methyltransferase involved in polyketide biosynthesis